jgi:hypothetical protein
VLSAAVGAAGHLDLDLAGQRIGELHRLHPLLYRLVQAHGARDPELAAVGARAADDVLDLIGPGAGELELLQPGPYVVDRLVADPAQDEVLLDAGAGVAPGEVAHDLGQAAKLVRAEVAARHLDDHGAEAVLALRMGVGLEKALIGGTVTVRARRGRPGRRRVLLLVVDQHQPVQFEIPLGDPVPLELLVHELAERLDADLVHQDLDPRASAILAEPVLAVEDAHDGLGDLQVLAAVELSELANRLGDARHDRGASSHDHLDAADAVADLRDEPEIVDPGDGAVGLGCGECRLELARHHLGRRVPDEVPDVGGRVGGDVEGLVCGDSRVRVAGDVAHRVSAALTRGQTGLGEHAQGLRRLGGRDVMKLDVLPRRDVSLFERRESLGDLGEPLHLLRAHAAKRQLHADHLDLGLALPVDPLLEPERDVGVLLDVPVEEPGRLGLEVLELVLEDRDHVPGDVLVDLRVLERADGPLSLPALLGIDVELMLGGDAIGRGALLHRSGFHRAILHKS